MHAALAICATLNAVASLDMATPTMDMSMSSSLTVLQDARRQLMQLYENPMDLEKHAHAHAHTAHYSGVHHGALGT